MEELIPQINRLQDVLTLVGKPNLIELPQIVVVGAQSSGKSSVLESIVGKDFLPRGSGIVTRRPLVLQLVNAEREWGEFLHRSEAFYNFSEIRHEIERETERLLGSNKGVSSEPINLKIYSPTVVDLTLVDLPGMTKNPVGDQPRNIESIIRSMVTSYISNPNSIILAITPANQDLQNSDALQIAREVDPDGNRTLGVITKLDLMDKDTHAVKIFSGEELPLRLGYVGIICRSQADINSDKPIRRHLKDEATFFKRHEHYRQFSHRMGVPYLSKRLNELLVKQISTVVPFLKKDLSEKLRATEEELVSYGFELQGNRQIQSVLVLEVVQKYIQSFDSLLEGRFMEKITEELKGGSKLHYLFFNWFQEELRQKEPLNEFSDQDIRTVILNTSGPKPALFVPEQAFEILVKSQIKKLEEPSLRCLQVILDELKTLNADIWIPEFNRFINLKEQMTAVIEGLLEQHQKPTAEMITNLFTYNLAFINTQHPEFIGGNQAIQDAEEELRNNPKVAHPVPLEKEPSRWWPSWWSGSKDKTAAQSEAETLRGPLRAGEVPTRQQLLETLVIKNLVVSYFYTVKKSVGDLVPKIIWTYLIKAVRTTQTFNSMQTQLIAELYREELFDSLLAEADDTPQKRRDCSTLVQHLKAASAILNQALDYSPTQ